MIFLEKLREHYVCTKIAILEAVSNKIAEMIWRLKETD